MAHPSGARSKKTQEKFSKHVILLKDGDFKWINGHPCHPTTIDMSEITSKRRKAQRKTVEFALSMSQEMVKARLEEEYPYLSNRSYSCAAVVKVGFDGKRFEFHGTPSLWDAKKIKGILSGNSSLYILEHELPHVQTAATADTQTHYPADINQCSSTHSLHQTCLQGEQGLLFDAIAELSFSSESPMEVDENHQLGVSGCTIDGNLGGFHADNGEFNLQNCTSVASILEEDQPSALSVNPGNLTVSDLTPSADNIAELSVRVPTAQAEPSHCDSSNEEGNFFADVSVTSGISEGDLDCSEEDLSLNNWIGVEVQFEVSVIPNRVPLQGGELCCFNFVPKLPQRVQAGFAVFEDLGTVDLHRVNDNDSLIGQRIPSSPRPGWVTVIVKSQPCNVILGETKMLFFDEDKKFIQRVVNDPMLQKTLFEQLARNIDGTNSTTSGTSTTATATTSQNSGSFGSTQPLQVLQLLVYVAAESGAQPFIEMIFRTTAGRVVFDSYKDISPLPEVIARNNGHEETAHYLEDISSRFSKETTICSEGSQTIDWSELVGAAEATQRELSHNVEEENGEVKNEVSTDTDYFGDIESSSSGSSELPRSDSEDGIAETFFKEIRKDSDNFVNDTCRQQVHSPGYESVPKDQTSQHTISKFLFNDPITELMHGRVSFVIKGMFRIKEVNLRVRRESNLFQIEKAHILQELASLHHRAFPVLLTIDNEGIPRHLNTVNERLAGFLASRERTTHQPPISFRKLPLYPAVMVESSLVKDNYDRKLSTMETQQLHPNSPDMESLYNRLVVGNGFPTPNDSNPPMGWKSSDCFTEQLYSNGSELWVLTCLFRPTRKTLFIYIADSRDVLPPESWFEDEDCELLIQCWKWQRCGNNLLKFSERPKEMKEPAGLEKSELEEPSINPLTYILTGKEPLAPNEGSRCPGWVHAVMHYCWTHDAVERPPIIAIFDHVSRDFVTSWIMTTGLRNDAQDKPPTLSICPPSDTCHVANVEKHEGKDKSDVTSFKDFTKYIIKSNETKPMYGEKFRPKVKELEDIPYNDVGTAESTVTVNINRSTSTDSWKHDLANCLAISKTLTTLHLTINNHSSTSGDHWLHDLGYGLAKSTTLTTLHLTINNHSSTFGDYWLYRLGYCLAKSATLTTLHITINNHSSTSGDHWLRGLGYGLAKSTTLTTLHLTINNDSSTSGDFWLCDLSCGLASSTTLTTLHLTINNDSSTSGWYWLHGRADCLAKSTSLSTLHITINDFAMSKDREKYLAKGLATLRESLTALTLTVNHHDAMDETTGSSDSNHWVRRLKSTPSATPALSSSAVKLTRRFCRKSSSLASHHLSTMDNAVSGNVDKLTISLPALGHAVDYYGPMGEITGSQVLGDSLKSTQPATPNLGSRRLLNS